MPLDIVLSSGIPINEEAKLGNPLAHLHLHLLDRDARNLLSYRIRRKLSGLTEAELWALSGVLFDRADALGEPQELVGMWAGDIAMFIAGYADALGRQEGRRGPWGAPMFDIEQPFSPESFMRQWLSLHLHAELGGMDVIAARLGL